MEQKVYILEIHNHDGYKGLLVFRNKLTVPQIKEVLASNHFHDCKWTFQQHWVDPLPSL